MELFIIRHARAAERSRGGDADRPLVEKGHRQAAAVGSFLREAKMLPELVLTSPLRRARETADGICRAAGLPGPVIQAWLGSGLFPEEAMKELVAFRDFQRIAVVGHEPDLSAWVEWLLSVETGRMEMKKASLVGLRVNPPTRAAEMMFLIPVKVLGKGE
jgi:phosphohistidine phosphatase